MRQSLNFLISTLRGIAFRAKVLVARFPKLFEGASMSDTIQILGGAPFQIEENETESWIAKSATVDTEADQLLITDQAGSTHTFELEPIRDFYFRPEDENPQEIVVKIWNKPTKSQSELDEVYAGTFQRNSETLMEFRKLIRRHRLIR